uniref:Uncharacterized protein n=1 Tax=Anthurium amnicola TaxID=1678845 RepID=A0A1D1YJQ3_9ARAE
MNSTTTFETKQEIEKQDPLSFILEKQTKEFEDFSKRMSLEFQSSYQEYLKQQNELKLRKLNSRLESECGTCQCKEKDVLINSMKARIEELEKDSYNKNQDIKKLQEKVQSLFNIIIKKGITNSEEIEEVDNMPTKITVTTELEEEIGDRESTKVNIVIEKDRLSVESNEYYDDDRDSYSDSAVDMFTDYDSSTGYSIKTDSYNKYDRPSEWLDVASLKRRNKIDRKNLDRWNSKMANNGLLPIKLVGKVDEEKEKKIQTHRKRYSTSAIWLKTYENRQKQDQQSHDDRFKIPSFNFSKYTFNTTNDVKSKQKESKELPDHTISLKSSVSTSVSDLYTTSVATTSLQPYELLEHHRNNAIHYSKSQQMLSQYK